MTFHLNKILRIQLLIDCLHYIGIVKIEILYQAYSSVINAGEGITVLVKSPSQREVYENSSDWHTTGDPIYIESYIISYRFSGYLMIKLFLM